MAQTQDSVIAALEREKKIAQLKKEVAEAKRDALLAQLPSSASTKGATGTVELKAKAGYFAELIAYQTLATAATEIAKDLGEGSQQTIVLTHVLDLSQRAQLWRLVKTRLEAFERRFDDLLKTTRDIQRPEDWKAVERVRTLTAALPALLGGIADIAAFFKVDREFSARDVKLDENALLAEVAAALRRKGWSVFLPSLDISVRGTLLEKLDRLAAKRTETAKRRRDLEVLLKPYLDDLAKLGKTLDAKTADLEKLKAATSSDRESVKRATEEVEELETQLQPLADLETFWKRLATDFDALLSGYDEYQKTLTEGSVGKPSVVETLAVVDVIQSQERAHRLLVGIVSQGAEIHVTTGVWFGRISYVGGSVCIYFWIDPDGVCRGSDSITLWRGKSVKARHGSEALNEPRVND
jgi:hypothetical protein